MGVAIVSRLTPRQWQVAALVAYGLCNKDVARALAVSEGTIKIHLHNIYRKLNINNRTVLCSLVHISGAARGE
jgi:DNA-binding NarL/FixJ family response regulator